MFCKFYKDLAGEWRWHVVGANGRIMADSSEGYLALNSAMISASQLLKEMSFRVPKSAQTMTLQKVDGIEFYDDGV